MRIHVRRVCFKGISKTLTDSSGVQPLRLDCSTRLLLRRELCADGDTKAEADARTQRMTASFDIAGACLVFHGAWVAARRRCVLV